jgi:peptidoglycan/LPS O-acetylase OafA/YrhL
MNEARENRNGNSFDFLRLFFAVMVVLFHIAVLSQNKFLLPWLGKIDGRLPVCGFFIISGFLISRSYARSAGLKDYFKKRMKRLLPGYLFVVLLCALAMVSLSKFSFAAYFINADLFKYVLCNLSFLNFLHPCLPGVFENNPICAVNGALWSIKVEVCFYLLVPVLFYFLNRTSKKILLLVALYALVLIHNYLLKRYLEPEHKEIYASLTNQLPALMAYFLSGMMLHFYFGFFLKNKGVLLLVAIPIFVVEYNLEYEMFLPLAFAVMVFYFAYSGLFRSLNNFAKNGDFSYGVYIFHFPIIQTLIYLGLFDGGWNVGVALFITILLTAAAALFSWHVIEKRFLALK